MRTFELVLAKQKTNYYSRISLLILLLNLAAIILVGLYRPVANERVITFVAAAVLVMMIGLALADKWRVAVITSSFALAIITWAMLFSWLPVSINLLLMLLYLNSKNQVKFKVNESEVNYRGLFAKTVHWQDISNVVLKDNLLTIDLKSNHLIQELIKTDNGINEKEFNEFCHQQIIVHLN